MPVKKTLPPSLLILDVLVAPLRRAAETLNEIQAAAPSAKVDIMRNGLFVLAVAAFETSLTRSLAYFLREFPQKLPKAKELGVSTDSKGNVPIEALTDTIEHAVDEHVHSLSYQTTKEVLDTYLHDLGINKPALAESTVDSLTELKETRNLLLHNRLTVNHRYLSKAGPKARAHHIDERLAIDPEYFAASLKVLHDLIGTIVARATKKYGDFTFARATRALWDHCLDSPACRFDDFWGVDIKADRVFAKPDPGTWPSHTETMFIWVFRTHYNDTTWAPLAAGFDMNRLDRENQPRMLFLLRVIHKVRLNR
jgi:hypothetical protein